MANLKYPEWQSQYKAVLLEFDPSRVKGLIAATEETIFARFQALSLSPGGEDERQAIADAVNALYAIKKDVLKSPKLDFDQSKPAQELSWLD